MSTTRRLAAIMAADVSADGPPIEQDELTPTATTASDAVDGSPPGIEVP